MREESQPEEEVLQEVEVGVLQEEEVVLSEEDVEAH